MRINYWEEFGRLTPAEVAVLSLSSPAEILPLSTQESSVRVTEAGVFAHFALPPNLVAAPPRIVVGKTALNVGCLFAEIYAKTQGEAADSLLDALDVYALYRIRVSVDGLTPPRSAGISDMGSLVDLLAERRVPLPVATPEVVAFIESRCAEALNSLEAKDLIIDPPRIRTIGGLALMFLVGSVPMDISYRTRRGDEMLRTVTVRTFLWDLESSESPTEHAWKMNLRIKEFVGGAVAQLAARYLEHWKREAPQSTRVLPPSAPPRLPDE